MSRQLPGEDARQPIAAHAAAKGLEIHDRYGRPFGWKELLGLLEDRAFVRYPEFLKKITAVLRKVIFYVLAPFYLAFIFVILFILEYAAMFIKGFYMV